MGGMGWGAGGTIHSKHAWERGWGESYSFIRNSFMLNSQKRVNWCRDSTKVDAIYGVLAII